MESGSGFINILVPEVLDTKKQGGKKHWEKNDQEVVQMQHNLKTIQKIKKKKLVIHKKETLKVS